MYKRPRNSWPECGADSIPPGSPIRSGMGRGRTNMDEKVPPLFDPNITSTLRTRKFASARSPPPRRRHVDEMTRLNPTRISPAGQRMCPSRECATASFRAPAGQRLQVDPFSDATEVSSCSSLETNFEPVRAPLHHHAALKHRYTVPYPEEYTDQMEIPFTCPAALNQTYVVPGDQEYIDYQQPSPATLNKTYTASDSEVYTTAALLESLTRPRTSRRASPQRPTGIPISTSPPPSPVRRNKVLSSRSRRVPSNFPPSSPVQRRPGTLLQIG